MGTRNGAAYLPQQLASLSAQDHADWSLWVSDDGSSDATRCQIRAFAETQPNPVLLLPGPQRGLTANYLSLLCHPDLPPGPVAFADQDDLWLPTHLTRGLTALVREPGPGQAYVARRMVLRAGRTPRLIPHRLHRTPGFRNALVECLTPGSGLILDAAATRFARQIGPVKVPFWDWWLYLILTGAEMRILHDTYPGILYRAHASNQLGPRVGSRAALWRVLRLMDGTYRDWVNANLAALEPHIGHLTPKTQTILQPLLPLPPGSRLRALSAYRQWPRDRLALWLAG
ncbi:glycosyltransferase [Marivita hallyeonensis]|nr:glycosyltransferase [Marivita hallyeonensis]